MRKLRTTTICGVKYTEFLAKPSEHPDLPGSMAITDHRTARVLYNAEHYDKATHAATRLHELIHIALFQTNLLVRITRDLKPGIDIDDVEEDIVAGLTAALTPLFAARVPK